MSEIDRFWVHTGTVETFTGAGPTGDTYAAVATIHGFLNDGTERVQTAGGEQLVQITQWFGPLADAAKFVPESKVTVNGRDCQVTRVHRRDSGNLGLPDHVQVDLT